MEPFLSFLVGAGRVVSGRLELDPGRRLWGSAAGDVVVGEGHRSAVGAGRRSQIDVPFGTRRRREVGAKPRRSALPEVSSVSWEEKLGEKKVLALWEGLLCCFGTLFSQLTELTEFFRHWDLQENAPKFIIKDSNPYRNQTLRASFSGPWS